MSKISAAIIVKNEERNIKRCLDSIKNFVDEIVVVDTGSTDNTVGVAKKYTDKIYFQKWKNDFSKARNYSISKCSNQWILYIDGDEELKINGNIDLNSEIDAYFLKVVNFDIVDNMYLSEMDAIRIFKKNKVYFENIVHNQPKGYKVTYSLDNLTINHYGYSRYDNIEYTNKLKRSLPLIKKQLKTNPTEYYFYQYFITLFTLQRYKEIIKIYKKYKDYEFKDYKIFQIVSFTFYKLNLLDRALKTINRSIDINKDKDSLYIKFQILFKKEKYKELKSLLLEYLNYNQSKISKRVIFFNNNEEELLYKYYHVINNNNYRNLDKFINEYNEYITNYIENVLIGEKFIYRKKYIKSLNILENNVDNNHYMDHILYERIAFNYLKIGNLEKAYKYYQQSFNIKRNKDVYKNIKIIENTLKNKKESL